MSSSSEIWAAFARTFSWLFFVLIMLVIFFYLIKRFSNRGAAGGNGLISVLAVHHISPKEKILLLDVLKEKILIGVTSQGISKLANIESDMDLLQSKEKKNIKFADFLSGKLMQVKGNEKDKQ